MMTPFLQACRAALAAALLAPASPSAVAQGTPPDSAHLWRAPSIDTPATLRQRGLLRVGVVPVEPMVMRNKRGDLVGFSIDLSRRLAADIGVDVEFVVTSWADVVPESMDDAQGTTRPDDPARCTLDFGTDGRATLRLDCNRAMAGYPTDAAASSLAFGPLAGMRAMCPPGSLEPRLVKALPYVRHYLVKDGRLHLTLRADGGILSWSPRP